ncbi:hypothetical protein HDV02_004285 [Globomyces sp. JEL0801]|nr:hypothetical protein HDV02_004285 [Globomyces sp. JEL0801]
MFVNQLIVLAAVSASPITERDDGPSTLIADHPELAKRSDSPPMVLYLKNDIPRRDINEEISCGGNSLYAINVPSDVINMPPQADQDDVDSYYPYWSFISAPYVCQNPLPFDFGATIDPFSPAQAQAICEHCSGGPCYLSRGDLSGLGFADENGIVFGYENGLGDVGRIWEDGRSFNNFGYWGKCFGQKICYVDDVDI